MFLADDEPWALMTLQNLIDWVIAALPSAEAEDREQALERIIRTNPDPIISDIRMPGMDGLSLLQTIRDRRAGGGGASGEQLYSFEYAQGRPAVRLLRRISGKSRWREQGAGRISIKGEGHTGRKNSGVKLYREKMRDEGYQSEESRCRIW